MDVQVTMKLTLSDVKVIRTALEAHRVASLLFLNQTAGTGISAADMRARHNARQTIVDIDRLLKELT